MVKPAGFYLDILSKITMLGLPVAAYQVSGEYSMIKSAAERGGSGKGTVLESLISIKRAVAQLIITYFAGEAADGSMKSSGLVCSSRKLMPVE